MSCFIKGPNLWRQGRTELEHQVLDELLSGRLDRRAFLRHGSRIGLSMAVMGAALQSVGLGPLGRAAAQDATPGGTIRLAQITPSGAIEPVSIADQGGLLVLQQVGDFLVRDGSFFYIHTLIS